MRENIWNHTAAGRAVLLFSSVWKPDETWSMSFWNDFSRETIQNYAVFCFSHFSLKWLVCVICCIQSVSFCFKLSNSFVLHQICIPKALWTWSDLHVVFAMDKGRFCFPKTIEEEKHCLERVVPKSIRYKISGQ